MSATDRRLFGFALLALVVGVLGLEVWRGHTLGWTHYLGHGLFVLLAGMALFPRTYRVVLDAAAGLVRVFLERRHPAPAAAPCAPKNNDADADGA